MKAERLRRVVDRCAERDYAAALRILEEELGEEGASDEAAALQARVAALAGDRERLNRAILWLTQQKGEIPAEFVAEGFYWQGDLVSALRTLESTRESDRSHGWFYLHALILYRQDRMRPAYASLLEFARHRLRAAEESELVEESLDLLAEGSLGEDQLEDWRMILGDCETEVTEGKPMGLRLSRLSEEIEKAIWSGDAERSRASFDRAFSRLAGQLGLEKPFSPEQAEEVLLPFVHLLRLAVLEEEVEQVWNKRDWGEIGDRFLEFFTLRLKEQRDRFELGDVEIERQDLLALSRVLPVGLLRPLVYLTTLARFPDHEVVERIFSERGSDVAVLVAMSIVSLASLLDVRPPTSD